jgi:deoxyadenosine/deoxycytidine kinase
MEFIHSSGTQTENMHTISYDKLIISIEGNIGVGKSTFVNILKNNIDDCEVVDEPVEMWKKLVDSDGKNILQLFYDDSKRWGYSFQNVACISRMIKIEEAIKKSSKKVIFLDRSLGTDRHIFEKMLYDSGVITEIEHQMYNMWCDFYYKHVRNQTNNVVIYLKSTPAICAKRILKRGREEEKNITLEYLTSLDTYHNNWLLKDSSDSNVIVIDCDSDFENDMEKQKEMINIINEKIYQLTHKNKSIEDLLEFYEHNNGDCL